jgi:hypothetical protein
VFLDTLRVRQADAARDEQAGLVSPVSSEPKSEKQAQTSQLRQHGIPHREHARISDAYAPAHSPTHLGTYRVLQ